MKFGTVASPQQVSNMARVIEAYCRQAGIGTGTPEEAEVASKVVALHEIGIRGPNDLLAGLILPPTESKSH